ncbi:hypothetical protein Sjap_020229 [Stephania japonica]|uniref:Glycosyl transferase family 1 domain-containing protein n=1 Tax=Stephania japonica TaxID=461633 RepID=A0AAP0I099_9MAGN
MGSVDAQIPSKRSAHPLLRSSSRSERHSFSHRSRSSRLARFLLFEKVDYLQWVCTVAVFCFVVILFQMFLPGSVTEKSGLANAGNGGDFAALKELGGLDFGEGVRFEPSKLLEKFRKESRAVNSSSMSSRLRSRAALRRPQLALVLADLSMGPCHLLMTSVVLSLREIGYSIQVYALEDGPVHVVWRRIGVPVIIVQNKTRSGVAIDWLNYDGVLVNSLEARDIISCLLQEPFKSIPVIWTIHERALAVRIRDYISKGKAELVNHWKQAFNRATVVVFPNYFLPMIYSTFDAGNFFVIPGSPDEAWEADSFVASYRSKYTQVKMGNGPDDFVVVLAGSQFSYSGLWLEQSFVLQALAPLIPQFFAKNSSSAPFKVFVLNGDASSSNKLAIEVITEKLGYPRGSVEHIGIDADSNSYLNIADLVIYGSFLEEQSFPDILIRAMCYGKPVVAPDLAVIKKYVDDGVNGYLFPKENIGILTRVLFKAISNGKLSPLSRNVASIGNASCRNLRVSEAIEGYASLLENVLMFPSEVAPPKPFAEIPRQFRDEWQWKLFKDIVVPNYSSISLRSYRFLDKVEALLNGSVMESAVAAKRREDVFSYTDWEEQKRTSMMIATKRREDDELKDRTDQPRGSWEEVYRNAKRAERAKNDLHERDDGELERTGQPLCIYEPYFGQGAWPFLHRYSLYRGVGLSTKGRRPGEDDVDAPSRLPLLNDPYYRNILGEFGAFFAIANRIDRIHKNAWIGFQSWRAVARKLSLSKVSESALLAAIQAKRHGDAIYFWVRMDEDPRNPSQQDFWSFCDAINAGNCRFAVSQALRRMYGLNQDWNSLPSMPVDGGTWSVMHSWVMPTRSFLEFVMFSRMFVDALDAQMYNEHHESGHCYLSLSKDRHCYSRVLELLVNVWAYHSARRMVYINPETGAMQVQHRLKYRRGKMWVRWFSYTTLKSMDEDLAEEFDSDHPVKRWLWPKTGEVFWQGVYERERNQRQRQKEKRKQQSKDKISRMRKRVRQKTIGKYVKPPPDDTSNSNSTATIANIAVSE